tara:strand:+ start:11203 stop:11985 length:783 start_codon:yes stop_codon:yes gene_type:complete
MSTDPSFDPFKGRNLISKISDFKVRTKADMKQLTELIIASLMDETGSTDTRIIYTIENAVLPVVTNSQVPEPKDDIKNDGSIYPTLFKSLRANAQSANAPETDKAILSSASWFYYNMEKPKQKSASIASYGTDEQNPIVQEQKKKHQRSKYIQWGVLGLSVIAGASMLYFAFKPQSKKKARNPRRRTSSGVGKVTKGRVRKRNRKAPILTKRKKNPVIPRTSSLSAYRKKHDAEKRAKAQKTNRKKTVRSKSKKGLRLKK